MAEIRLEHVSKSFDRKFAIQDLTLDVQDRELLVLLGPTGAGKTTTLRCVAGLEKPESGHIYVDGQCIDDWTPAERDVAFVFQSHILYPHLTVYENIAFPLHPRKLAESEIREKVLSVAQTLHIEHLLARKPAQLSGGEIQRVGLGRAMVREPRVYLMDEPLTNLDAKLRTEMRAELKWRHREMGVTTFYVTHDQVEAMTMGDRVAVLNEGQLQQIASPMEVYDHPANLFVAGLVGSPAMNLLEACIATEDDQMHVALLHTDIRIPLGDAQRQLVEAMDGQESWVFGVRAEDIRMVSRAGDEAEVYAVEPLGADTLLDLSLGRNPNTERDILIRARTGPFEQWLPGSTVGFQFVQGRTHLFRGDTGEALL